MIKYTDNTPTLRDLQESLIEEVSDVLRDIVTVNPNGDKVTGIKGFAQYLPKTEEYDTDPDKVFPYFIVRFLDAETVDAKSTWDITISILIGIHDSDINNHGHYVTMEIIEKIINHFSVNGVAGPFSNRAVIDDSIKWILQDEDSWPYFFGGIELTSHIAKPRRESPFNGY